jgi:hypothetical protein
MLSVNVGYGSDVPDFYSVIFFWICGGKIAAREKNLANIHDLWCGATGLAPKRSPLHNWPVLKQPKAQVDYSRGHRDAHWGKVFEGDRNYCRHFIRGRTASVGSCEKVAEQQACLRRRSPANYSVPVSRSIQQNIMSSSRTKRQAFLCVD